jgi:hypothetical protein
VRRQSGKGNGESEGQTTRYERGARENGIRKHWAKLGFDFCTLPFDFALAAFNVKED